MSLVLLPMHTFKWPEFTAACIWPHKEPIKADLSFNATPMTVTDERKPHTRIANNGKPLPTATRLKSMGVDVVSNILYKYYIVNNVQCQPVNLQLWISENEKRTLLCPNTSSAGARCWRSKFTGNDWTMYCWKDARVSRMGETDDGYNNKA